MYILMLPNVTTALSEAPQLSDQKCPRWKGEQGKRMYVSIFSSGVDSARNRDVHPQLLLPLEIHTASIIIIIMAKWICRYYTTATSRLFACISPLTVSSVTPCVSRTHTYCHLSRSTLHLSSSSSWLSGSVATTLLPHSGRPRCTARLFFLTSNGTVRGGLLSGHLLQLRVTQLQTPNSGSILRTVSNPTPRLDPELPIGTTLYHSISDPWILFWNP